ncbi:uncharacterized protein LOC125122441 [Phacochoerus africanus]|uniref:uncharacterized protein LOC125122441 n=1 Tax=Phacochoerus africanus TaxID=41426 RepID=UPI001FD8B08A|nr:uncharacterized protein LOC125122441 [Phacochoerus africanus]XP_047626721.1 uncharacterized protein LOC125122441 [Phacochoerus africanus]XP_047626722.1 uncharacterized protein LOC125122441 [Phacochoerus africanus]XP_047626724.1 uncharacterized protein LOC125122441 [Phacochoerus africanus]XP_047626725.1 uncharacterized protein LOC125122441 [Phacochoerus africanus]XP_047626726.1 uncharacterized protein LOC125122441 [Phacochoerus africanus]XP_047626727.1 uncharacterized protein LOC125122441 [
MPKSGMFWGTSGVWGAGRGDGVQATPFLLGTPDSALLPYVQTTRVQKNWRVRGWALSKLLLNIFVHVYIFKRVVMEISKYTEVGVSPGPWHGCGTTSPCAPLSSEPQPFSTCPLKHLNPRKHVLSPQLFPSSLGSVHAAVFLPLEEGTLGSRTCSPRLFSTKPDHGTDLGTPARKVACEPRLLRSPPIGQMPLTAPERIVGDAPRERETFPVARQISATVSLKDRAMSVVTVVWKELAVAGCGAPWRCTNSRAVGPAGAGSRGEWDSCGDIAPHSGHVVRVPAPRPSSPCRVGKGLELPTPLARGRPLGGQGWAEGWAARARGQLTLLLEAEAHAGRMGGWHSNNWGIGFSMPRLGRYF